MRVGFDAKRLFLNNTGLGNYSRTLMKNLVRHHPEHEYILYTPTIERNAETEYFFNQQNIVIRKPEQKSLAWRSFGIKSMLLEDEIDIFHGLSNELPFGISNTGIKSVVTIHDVIFKRYPKQYPFLDRIIYHYKTKRAIQEATQILSISNQTTEDLVHYYGAPEEKISLIYQTCNESFTSQNGQRSHPTNDFFLYVGSVIERKNLLTVLKALKAVSIDQRKKLIVVGGGKDYLQKCKKFVGNHDLSNWVEWKSSILNSQLVEYYKNAAALIYPSMYEGFGIPVLEAQFCGCPVITSNRSSLREVGGKAALLIDPTDQGNVRWALESIINAKFKTNASDLEQHLDKFKAQRLSCQLIQMYESILNG